MFNFIANFCFVHQLLYKLGKFNSTIMMLLLPDMHSAQLLSTLRLSEAETLPALLKRVLLINLQTRCSSVHHFLLYYLMRSSFDVGCGRPALSKLTSLQIVFKFNVTLPLCLIEFLLRKLNKIYVLSRVKFLHYICSAEFALHVQLHLPYMVYVDEIAMLQVFIHLFQANISVVKLR